jgi:rod shape determining protein RodA
MRRQRLANGGSSTRRITRTGPFSPARVRWSEVAWHVLLVALVLAGVGVVFIHAMAGSEAALRLSDVSFDSHLQKLLISLPMIVVGLLIDPRWLRRNAFLIFGAAVVLLLLVPLIGEERNQARRWIDLGLLDLQPSELAKLGLIIVLARLLSRNRLRSFRDWWIPGAFVALPVCLVFLQPDLGTALAILPIAAGMFHLAGASGRLMGRIALVSLIVGFAAWQFQWVQDYQLRRIDTWVASQDAQSLIDGRNRTGFHVYHARVAIGNGGLTGRGLGEGIANETGYLPERDSDSIFAVIAEEAGLVGASSVLLLYSLLVVLLLGSASTLRDRFTRLTVAGIALYFGAHLVIHTAVNLGLLPMTGLPLPLISTGGSSLLTTCLALGLALGLAAQPVVRLERDAFQ